MAAPDTTQRIPGYCALCTSSCGCISVVENGRLVAVEPDPSHPTGAALCSKGRAAPDLVHHEERLLHPVRRTRPKGDPDPGWERISWDEALDTTAAELSRLARTSGPESVAFGITTPSGTSLQDSYPWIERLRHLFGSPNVPLAAEICNFHRDNVYAHTFGVWTPMPDLAHTDCVVLWGHNPSTTWLAFASRIAAAKARGAKLIVVDPRRAGLAVKADQWLRVRPGTDGALALGIANLIIEDRLYDAAFLREWTNGPFLVRDDDGRLLSGADLGGDAAHRVAWDASAGGPVLYDPGKGVYAGATGDLALNGRYEIATGNGGSIPCRPAFDRYAELCRAYPPERVEATCWVPEAELRAAARLIGEARSVSCYGWAGVGQHTNASQTSRAMAVLYALTGSFDSKGGNVAFDRIPVNDVAGGDLMAQAQWSKTIGLDKHPLGPELDGWITTDDLYDAILEGRPYRVKGMMNFGTNMLLSHADTARGAEALKALEFTVQADLFINPSASFADIVLPVNSAWEREGLCTNFKVGQDAVAFAQLRPPVIEPRGESRSDLWIAFALATRLGFAEQFWNGDIDASYREVLAPSGLTLEELRQKPDGVRVDRTTRYRKYAEIEDGAPVGFATPSRKVEIFSDTLARHGYPPFPDYVEPGMGPVSRSDLSRRFPLVLTSAKSLHYCHSQHRGMPALRKREPDPIVEIHPDSAASRGIADGDWVDLSTPHGAMRARARLRAGLDPRVVSATAGWWQACTALGLPGFDPTADDGGNFNGVIGNDLTDPLSGSVPHKSYLCQIGRAAVG